MTRARDLSNDEANGGGATPPFTAGKNAIINGDFGVWQRGTSFTTTDTYTSDRWKTYLASAGSITRDSTLVPAGSIYGARLTSSSAGFTGGIAQSIETLKAVNFAGKTVTLSAQIAGTVGKTASIQIAYSTSDNVTPFGTWTVLATSATLTATGTFQRITVTGDMPSTARSIRVYVGTVGALASTEYLTFGQVQLEAGNVATPFQTATGTIQGELAACQRYYYEAGGDTAYDYFGTGFAWSASYLELYVTHPVKMRVAPTLSVAGTFQYYGGGGTGTVTLNATQYPTTLGSNVEFAASGLNAGQGYMTRAANNTATRLKWSAEL